MHILLFCLQSITMTLMQRKTNILHFPVILQEEPEGGFTVTVPSLPGCITFGKTLQKAKQMAKEAIELYLEDMEAEGERISFYESTYLSEIEIELHKPLPLHA